MTRYYRWHQGFDEPPVILAEHIVTSDELEKDIQMSRISGSLQVQIVPYSTAEVNPEKISFCLALPSILADPYLSTQFPQSRSVPVRLSGIPPWTLSTQFSEAIPPFQTTTADIVVPLDDVDPDAIGADQRVEMIWDGIDVDRPGNLSIISLRDLKGEDGSITSPTVSIRMCPYARFSGQEPNFSPDWSDISVDFFKREESFCEGESSAALPIWVVGDAPVRVSVDRYLDGTFEERKEVFVKQTGNNLHVANFSSITFDRTGVFQYLVSRVSDVKGHLTEFTATKDFPVTFQVFSRPSVEFETSGAKPVYVVTDDKNNQVPVDIQPFRLRIYKGIGPFTVKYQITTLDGSIQEKELLVKDRHDAKIPVEIIGTYRLKSIGDKNCGGTVGNSDTIKVKGIEPPTISVQHKPIESPCLGQIGLHFSLNLTGTGPWKLTYLLHHSGDKKATEETATLQKPHDSLDIKPKLPGIYTVTFTHLQDARFPHRIPIENVKATQEFHAPSQISLSSSQQKICISDLFKYELQPTGTKPWTVTFTWTSPSGKSTSETIQLESSKQMDRKFEEPGSHYLEVTQMKDGVGCEASLPPRGLSVEVIDSRPSVKFETTDEVMIPDFAQAALNVRCEGAGPWTIGYEMQQANSDRWILKTVTTSESRFKLNAQVGTYRLASIRDQFCAGSVQQPNSIVVKAFTKPNAAISNTTNMKESSCIESAKILSFEATGKPPFLLRYTIEHDPCYFSKLALGCKKSTEHSDFSSVDYNISAPLPTHESGKYTVRLVSISDDHYQNIPVSGDAKTFSYLVEPSPTASFLNPEPINICVGGSVPESSWPKMELTGKEPWKLTFESRFDGVENMTLGSNELSISKSPTRFSPKGVLFNEVGIYSFHLSSLSDKNGCRASAGLTNQMVQVTVSQAPSLSALSTMATDQTLCVGDVLQFRVHGIAPFEITYSYNEQDHSLSVDEKHAARPVSVRVADPGLVRIRRICHGKSQGGEFLCCRDINDWEWKVADIPSAVVNSGRRDKDVIREGKQARMVIKFIGEPPFAFSYVRKSDTGIELESHSLSDIQTNEYDMPIAQAGIFEVTSIADKYCSYPRRKRP